MLGIEIAESHTRRSTLTSRASMSWVGTSSYLMMNKREEEELALTQEQLGTSSVTATVMNLITVMIGAGVLGYPKLFRRIGIPLGVAMIVGCCALSAYLCKTLSDAIGRVQDRKQLRVEKLEDLGVACFGHLGRLATRVVINSMFIGKVGCYMVLIGQNLAFLLSPPGYRGWVVIAGVALVGPAFMRDVSKLEKIAFVGVISCVVYFVTIVGGSFQARRAGFADRAELSMPSDFEGDSLFSILTVMLFGFGPTDVLATVRHNMADAGGMTSALVWSHGVVGVVYVAAGTLGYWGFGLEVEGNVSQTMCEKPWPCAAGGEKWVWGYALAAAVVANLAVTIPIVLYCLFSGIEASFPKSEPMGKPSNAGMRIGVVLLCTSVGLFVPFFLEVLSIISAVLVVPIVIFFPLAFGYKSAADSGQPYSVARKTFDCLIFLLGIACFVVGLIDAIGELVEAIDKDPGSSDPFSRPWF